MTVRVLENNSLFRPLLLAAALLIAASLAANATQITIVAIGASNTVGWGTYGEEVFPAKLEALLKQQGYDVQVKNAGATGATTVRMLERLDTSVPDGVKLVILQSGVNDYFQGISAEKREANIEEIIRRLSTRGVTTIRIDKMLYALPKQYLQSDGLHLTAEGHTLIANQLLRPVIDGLGAPAR